MLKIYLFNVMAFGSGAYFKVIRVLHKVMRVGPWSDGISTHLRRDIRQLAFLLSALGGESNKAFICQLGKELSAEPNLACTPISGKQPLELQESEFLFLKPLSLCCPS